MVRLIEQAIRTSITGLNFIERYGAVAIPVTVRSEGQNGAFFDKTFPVSADISSTDCFEGGKHTNLVPNDQYKSVAYLEQLGPSTLRMESPKLAVFKSTTRLRLVCWLNMLKLGLDDVKGTTRFELAALNALAGTRTFTVDSIAGRLDITTAGIAERNIRNIFGAYSYADKQAFFFWPYDFFAVDFEAAIEINSNCLTAVTLGTEIECLTNW